jgi:hypothetical protein
MELSHKVLYEAPSTTVFEVRQEGVICASDPTFIGMNQDEEVW